MSVLTKAQMEEIYRRNCDMVYRVCLMHLKHEQDAFDTVHLSEEGKQQVFDDICNKYEKKKNIGCRKWLWQHVCWPSSHEPLDLQEKR